MATIPHLGHGQVRSFRMPADFWLRRADRCRERNQPLRAVTLLRHAAQVEPDSADIKLEYALQLRALNAYEASARECRDLLAEHPACFAAFGLLSQNMLSLGNMSEAMDAYAIYAQYARMFPDDLPPWDEDVYDVEDALALLPDQKRRPLRLEALLKAAGARLQRGQPQKARLFLRRAMEKPFPRKLPQRDALLALYYQALRQPKKAQAYAMAALRGAPAAAGLLLPMAMLLHQLHAPAALPALVRAAITACTPEDELGVCVAATDMGCPALAEAMLKRTLKYAPNRTPAAYDLCVFSLRRGDLSAASAPIHRLREIDPEDQAVEALFAVVNDLEAQNVSPQAVAQAGRERSFYGMDGDQLAIQNLYDCFMALNEGFEAFASRLLEDKRLYRQFISLFAVQGDAYALLPGICEAMEQKRAIALLRRVLLAAPGDAAIRVACRLLKEREVKPPFLMRLGGRLVVADPDAPPPVTPTFLQRMLYRRLRETLRACGGYRQVLPFALQAIAGMPKSIRLKLAGDAFHVWPQAFKAAYSRALDLPLPKLDGQPVTKPRLQAYMEARRDISKALLRRKALWR